VATPIIEIFEEWVKAISAAGITKIEGSIVGDDRFFKDETIPDSWSWSNIGPSYGSAASGLSICENAQFFKLVPGKNIGDKVSLESVYPEIPDMVYINNLITSGPYTGDRSSYYVSDLAKTGKLEGSLPYGKDSVMAEVSNKFASLSCAWEFRKFLVKKGIASASEVKDAKTYSAPFLFELKIIGETFSPKLSSIINVTNRISNNFYAETLFKMIGKTVTGVGSYDSARVAVRKMMKEMNLSTRGYTQVDGSGLSRQDYVSARFFCKYFSKLKESNVIVGKALYDNKIDLKEKSKIHAKSGSLANVKCYAGFVERSGGDMYYFAILTNNYSARTAQIQVGLEGFMRELVR